MDSKPKLIVGIGASAGGIKAVSTVLENLPDKTDMSFVIVLHLDPNYKSNLAGILNKKSTLPVQQVNEPLRMEPDVVYLISPNTRIEIVDGLVIPEPRQRKDGPPKPINTLLKTLSEFHGSKAIGIILTGEGDDGSEGVKSIKEYDGLTIVQHPDEAEHPSMPLSSIDSGHADLILSLSEIPVELVRLANLITREPHTDSVEKQSREDKNAIDCILKIIFSKRGVNFANYKQSTIIRRLHRRMAINRLSSLKQYAEFIEGNSNEQNALFEDILIKVTRFFRDPEIFQNLQKNIFPKIWPKDTKRNLLRIWVPACASGEEVYSLAMTILEYFDYTSQIKFQFFGTDLSEGSVNQARKGLYPKSIESQISKERLSQFFIKVPNGYQVSQILRDMCIFSRHDISRDPPFAHIDFLSCRNLLIYFNQELQKQVIPLFHYSLGTNGVLMLSPSETLHQHEDLFELTDKQSKIYRRLSSTTPRLNQFFPVDINRTQLEVNKPTGPENSVNPLPLTDQSELFRKADDIVLRYLSPPGFLINGAMDVIQYRGDTNFLIAPSHGLSSLNLLKLIRSDLVASVQSVLRDFDRKGPVKNKELIQIEHNGEVKYLRIRVTPVFTKNSSDHYSLITFHNEKISPLSDILADTSKSKESEYGLIKISELERQLFETKELLRESVEKQEATYEELKAANEEILSSNEELQSTNEELEASKEELQSSNEELSTVNEELHNRNESLNSANDDLRNLLEFSQIATIMLGRDLKIRRFTPEAEKLFRLMKNDVGRPLSHLNPIFKLPDLETRVRRVIDKMQSEEVEIEIPSLGNRYTLEIRPYRTAGFQIAGALVGLTQVSEQQIYSQNINRKYRGLETTQRLLDALPQPILLLNEKLNVAFENEEFCAEFGIRRGELLEKNVKEIKKPFQFNGQVMSDLKKVLSSRQVIKKNEIKPKKIKAKYLYLIDAHPFLPDFTDTNYILVTFQKSTLNSQSEG